MYSSFQEYDARFEALYSSFQEYDCGFEECNARFHEYDSGFDEYNARFEASYSSNLECNARFEELYSGFDEYNSGFEECNGWFEECNSGFDEYNFGFQQCNSWSPACVAGCQHYAPVQLAAVALRAKGGGGRSYPPPAPDGCPKRSSVPRAREARAASLAEQAGPDDASGRRNAPPESALPVACWPACHRERHLCACHG